MIVGGVMSGTSADGINVALVEIRGGERGPLRLRSGPGRRHTIQPGLKLLGHLEFSYPPRVRKAVLAAMNARQASVADLTRLNFLLGELYSEAVLATQKKLGVKAELVGCHGQTLYHQGETARFHGRKLAVTWQTGEAAVVAARVGVPVVSDFRPADMAVGGKGAPLVPFLDYLLYRDKRLGRIAQNIGGIANLTAIPPNGTQSQVIAFDTGPGNMVIDAIAQRLFDKPFDRGGRLAASGKTLEPVLGRLLREPYFLRRPPKTAGREEFGREFVQRFLKLCGRADKKDVIATATALTARSILDAIRRFVPWCGSAGDFIVSGGGSKNSSLLTQLGSNLRALNLTVCTSDSFGLPMEAKEAVAFAVLAHEPWHRRPSNVPSATGARQAAVLGKISYP